MRRKRLSGATRAPIGSLCSFSREARAMSDTIQRMGILTGGGDCPGLNAVIRAAVKTAINEYGWEVLGIEDGFEGLIKPHKARLLDIADVRGLLPRGGTMRIAQELMQKGLQVVGVPKTIDNDLYGTE